MSAGPDSILLIKMSAFGDIICALPTLRALRAVFPQARIGWVVDERFRELVECEPQIDEVVVAPLGRWGKEARKVANWPRITAERARLRRQLRAGGWQVALDLQGILKSGSVTRMARAPRVLHMAGGRIGKRRLLFPGERIPAPGEHTVDRMLALAAALGADISRPQFDFHIPAEDQAYADALLAGHDFGAAGPLIALNPGAFAPHRTWAPERFAALARALRERLDARIVIPGGPGEVGLAQGIADEAGVKALSTAGRTTYRQLAGLLARCDVVVSSDTGPMHLAVGVGRPVVALFGPSDPSRTGPHGSQNTVVHVKLPCWPCFAHPTCTDFACMKEIGVGDVADGVARVLS